MTDFATLGIDVDSRGLVKGRDDLRKLEDQGRRTERETQKSAKGITASWGKVGKAIGAVAVAAVAALSAGAVVRGIADFEKSMARVGAISGATEKDLLSLRNTAKKLGSTTEFSAGQAADALGFLSMAGFEARESMAAIPAVLDLATAAGMDLAQSADIASNVLSGFGKEAGEAASVADVLAEAASTTNTSVSQLGRAMSTVAPISAALGISMEETAAAIGVMSDAGIQGERAGTALRGVMSSLAGPTKQASDALAKYGLTAEDVNPELHSLTEIMGTLRDRGLSTADAMVIFGREAASGALVMAETADRMGDLTDQFEGANGAASQMAATVRDNLSGDLSGLLSATEGLIIAMGDAGLTATLRMVAQGVTGVIRTVSEAIAVVGDFRGYVIAAAAAATVTMIPALTAITGAIYTQVAAWATLRGVMMASGYGLVIVAVGLVINKIIQASNALGGFGNLMAAVGEVFYLAFQGMKQVIESFKLSWKAFTSYLNSVWLGFISGITSAWAGFLENVAGALSHIPKMEAQFTAVSNAAFDAATKASVIEAQVIKAETATASLADKARTTLATAFDPAIKKASQLWAIIANVGAAQSTGPDDGSRGGQMPNAPAVPGIISPISPIAGGGGGGGGARDSLSVLDRMLNGVTEQTPREKIEAWHSEVMSALEDANLKERGMLQEHNDYKLEIERLYQDQLAALRRRTQDKNLSHYQSFFGSMAQVTKSGGEKMLKISKVFGLAEAAVSIWRGAAKALELPFPANLAAWGTVIATGAQALAGISSVRPGSSGGAASGGGASGAGADAAAAQPPRIYLDIQPNERGDIPMETFTGTIDTINDALWRGGRIVSA